MPTISKNKTAPMIMAIDISRPCSLWPALEEKIEKAVQLTLETVQYKKSSEVSIVLADDPFVQDLNKTYRGQDKPTNVLSFPQDEEDMLGDIILAYETLKREAEEQSKTFEDHTLHMIVHGLLHLLGFDHEHEDQAQEMEALEIKILQSMGIKNPYES